MSDEKRYGAAEGKRDVLHRIDAELIEWLDVQSARWERSRAWCIEQAVRNWRCKLERDRARRKKRSRRK